MRYGHNVSCAFLVLVAVLLTACDGSNHHRRTGGGGTGGDGGTGGSGTVTPPPPSTIATTHHEDGNTSTVDHSVTTTPSAAGTTVTAPPVTPIVPNAPLPVPATTTLLFSGMGGGASHLGEVYQLSADSSATKVLKTFTGRPYTRTARNEAHSLVFNPADNKFYGILDDAGYVGSGVVYSFDPGNDKFEVLKTLSRAGSGKTAGLNGDVLTDEPRADFRRRPLLSGDGKSMLLLAEGGGRDGRGLLIHVNLDQTSANYLQETVVYDFFEFELAQGDYCKSLGGTASEMAWGKDGLGGTVVYLGRNGEDYTLSSPVQTTEPATCPTGPVTDGKQTYRKWGRMFALKPSNSTDLSQPWTFVSLGNFDTGEYRIDPLNRLGRHIFYDETRGKVRWTTETVGGGLMGLMSGADSPGSNLYWGTRQECYRMQGLLNLRSSDEGILLCSGLNGSDPAYPGISDAPPLLFTHTNGNGQLVLQNRFDDLYPQQKMLLGATYSDKSRLLFLTTNDIGEDCANGAYACVTPGSIEEVSPGRGFVRRLVTLGDQKTTGRAFMGDPAVGGAATEPLVDRYVVWVGFIAANASMVINKYDRVTDKTTTVRLDTDAGAYPFGKLLDLGNGTAMGRIGETPPHYDLTANPDKIGGYKGAPIPFRNFGAKAGVYIVDVKTGNISSFAAQAGDSFSPELARTSDGSIWGTRYVLANILARDEEEILAKIDPATGKYQKWVENTNVYNDGVAQQIYIPAARGMAVYFAGLDSVVYTGLRQFNTKLTCVRAEDKTVASVSGLFGPATQSNPAKAPVSNDAYAPLWGPTYSPTHQALYMATTRIGTSDLGAIFEVDKGVADADLCRQPITVTPVVANLPDVPSTKFLVTKSGQIFYGTTNGKLMKLDPVAKQVTQVADLKASVAASSAVRGFLTEIADDVIGAVVFDYDANGKNIGRRLAGVSASGTQTGSHDVSALIAEDEPYPGVNRFN